MATRHYVPRAWAVRLHQRHPGELSRGRHRHRLRQAAQALVRGGLRHRDQPAAGRRADPRRRGAGPRRALFEHCLYDERGQLLNGNMADYLVPMAAEMPDIEVGHVVTPTADPSSAPRAPAKPAPPARRPRDERDQRRAAAARRQAAHRHAVYPGRILHALGKVLATAAACSPPPRARPCSPPRPALPRPSWYTANLRGMPLSYGFSQAAYREAAFRLPRLQRRRPAPRRHRHLRGRRRAARRRRRRPKLGELRHRAHRRHRQAAGRGAAGALHGRQGPRRPDVGGDRDPHDAAGRRQDRRDHGSSSIAPTRRWRR